MFIFQFTPLREGRRRSGIAATARILFQFTPLREGRRLAALCCACADVSISIHAPPRGATPQARTAASIMAYFNSRPSARGDVMKQVAMWDDYKFQFTPLREGRPGITLACKPHALVFQFTPLREGRPSVGLSAPSGVYFNSRPSARGDHGSSFLPVKPIDFNSRPSARGDQHGGADRPTQHHFNSRPSARGDDAAGRAIEAADISIHAPPRGATGAGDDLTRLTIFQFTPLREGRHDAAAAQHYLFKFQFTPLREGRRT